MADNPELIFSIRLLMISITIFSGVFASVTKLSKIPPKIALIPFQACSQFPENTPVINSMIPEKICFISFQIRSTAERNVFKVFCRTPKLKSHPVSNVSRIKFRNGWNTFSFRKLKIDPAIV